MMLIGAEKLAALFAGRCAPRFVCFLGRVIGAEISDGAISSDARFVAFSGSRYIDATQRSHAVTTIPAVLLRRRFSKILPTIIGRITVFVIDFIGSLSGLHDPDYPLSFKHFFVHMDADVSICHRRSRYGSGPPPVPSLFCGCALEMMEGPHFPSEDPSRGVIRKAFSQVRRSGQRLRFHLQSLAMGAGA